MKYLVLLIVLLEVATGIGSAQPQALPLERALNADGTFNPPPNYAGTFDPRGWKLRSAPDGSPRFLRETADDPADAQWDADFVSGDLHLNGEVRAMAVIGGSLYLGGAFTSVTGTNVNHIISWQGDHWAPLGSGVDAAVYAFAVIGTTLYVGGDFASPYPGIAKWDGSNWSGLGSGTNSTVYALTTDGVNVYAGGTFGLAGGVGANHVAKWNGSSWSALGIGTNATVTALAAVGSAVYAGGYFGLAGGIAVNQIARWNGSAWDSLGGGVDGSVSAIAASGSDVYIAGSFSMAGSIGADNIARWDGSAWDSLGSGVNGTVYALAVDGSDLYAAGDFSAAGGAAAKDIAKWNGTAWSSPGGGLNAITRAVVVSGMNVFTGGNFTVAGSDSATRAARWNGSTWSALGTGLQTLYGGGVFLTALAGGGSNLYVAGYFDIAGGVRASNVAKWDGTKWSPLGAGIPPTFYVPIYDITAISQITCLLLDGSNLYIGGQFDTAGTVPAQSVAKWNGSSWSALGSGIRLNLSPNIPGWVYALTKSGTDIVAGGYFSIPVANLAKWNGSTWSAIGTGVDGNVYTLAAADTGFYAGGDFTHAGGGSANHIARWNGSAWSALGTGADSAVLSLSLYGTGLYAGGRFLHAGGISATRVARWDGSAWSSLNPGISGGFYCAICIPSHFPAIVSALAQSEGSVFAGGTYDSAGGKQISSLAAWSGGLWSSLGSGLIKLPPFSVGSDSTLPEANAFQVDSEYLYVAGEFSSVGGKQATSLARWKLQLPSRTLSLQGGWNLLSLPLSPPVDSATVLFPDAVSNAFGYSGSYQVRTTLTPGNGYWIKLSSPGDHILQGTLINADTISVLSGWNLVGSTSEAIPVSAITSNPPGMVTGSVFAYKGSYVVTDTIRPGGGYWIKVSEDGQLILSSPGMVDPNNRIRILATSELPPAPPDDAAGPQHVQQVPHAYALEQNYPNPFNPSTVIGYQLAERSLVSLNVYDLLGQVVSRLVEGVQEAGEARIEWNAGEYPSGVYFYRLEATSTDHPGRSFSAVRKLLLAK